LAYRLPSFGTFSTNLNPVYSFGVPRQVEMSGIMVDMDVVNQSVWTKDNDAQLVKTVVQQIGMQTSAWEHKIPEMLFSSEEYPGEAVSAVKALGVAAAEGQRIYQITKDNVDAVLPTLNIGFKIKREIKDSVAVGKVATVSQNNITVGSWTGVGYIIADADTGAGAYRISGGSNGAHYMGFFIGFFLTLAIVSSMLGAIIASVLAAFMLGLAIGFSIYLMYDNGVMNVLPYIFGGFFCGVAVGGGGIAAFGAFASLISSAMGILLTRIGAIAFIHSVPVLFGKLPCSL